MRRRGRGSTAGRPGRGPDARRGNGTRSRVTAPAADACTNCGAPLAGRYCHACGQDSVPDQTALASWRDQWRRLLRTLRALLLEPGRLTREHLSGGRVRYVAPFTLFVNVVTLFFLLSVVTGFRVQSFVRDDATRHLERSLERRAERAGVTKEVFAERAERRFQGVYTVCLATISLAGYTLLFRLFFRRQWRGWRGPFTLALHYLAFIFLVFPLLLAAMNAAGAVFPAASVRPAGAVASVVLAAGWLALASRRLFAHTWPWALAKAGGIVATGFVVDNLMFVTAVFATFTLA